MRIENSSMMNSKQSKPQGTGWLENPHDTPRTVSCIAILLIITTATIIYSNSLNSPFVFDDFPHIADNSRIRLHELSVSKVIDLLKSSGNRPVPALSFALNYYFGGYVTVGYHITNVLIHALNGILLFFFILITMRLSKQSNQDGETLLSLPISIVALLASLLWVVHPVNTQSVTYIVQRMNSLATLFCMLSLLLYIAGRSIEGRRRFFIYTLAAVSWLMAAACKENAAILPLILILYEWYFFQDLDLKWLKQRLKFLLAVLMVFGVMTAIFLGSNPVEKLNSLRDFSEGRFTYTERLLTQFRVVIYYVSLFIYPHPSRLNIDYDFPLSVSLFNPVTTIVCAILIAACLLIGVLTAKNNRIVSFCLFWFFINLAIESSFIPLAIIFEHRTYMPFMGLAMLLIYTVDRYVRPSWFTIFFCSALIASGSYWTYQRNATWKDAITLWQDCLDKTPRKARPHLSLGAAYAAQENFDKAMIHYQRALEIEPDFVEAYNNIGNLRLKEGLLAQAEQLYRKVLKKRPVHVKAHFNIALALHRQDKPNDALYYLKKLVQIDHGFTEAHLLIGDIYGEQENIHQAIKYYKEALKISPGLTNAYNSIGKLYAKGNELEKAEFYFKAALKKDPSNSDAMVNIGKILQDKAETPSALSMYQQAIAADPENANAHFNLATIYMVSESADQAEKHYRIALEIDNSLVEAHVNLAALLEKRGNSDLALAQYRKAIELKPTYASPHNNIGNIFAQRQDFQTAILHYREAVRLDPAFDDAHANLGIALLRAGALVDAEQQFQLALKINPANHRAREGLQLTRSTKEPPGKASPEELHREAIEHAAWGDYAKAAELFKKILDIVPSEPGTCYNIACMYAKMGRIPESIEWLSKAIQNGYDNWNAIKNDPDLDNIRESDAFKALVKNR